MTVMDVKHNPTLQTSYVCPQHTVNISSSAAFFFFAGIRKISSVQDDNLEASVDSSCRDRNNSEDNTTAREVLNSYLPSAASMTPYLSSIRIFHGQPVFTSAVCGSTLILRRRRSSHGNTSFSTMSKRIP
jgi:hypothetical protein